MEIRENEYLRFGGLKRLLIENNVDEKIIGQLCFIKKDFSTFASYFFDQELKELQGSESFWTEYDYEKHTIYDTEFSFSRPIEKYNPTYYSHYAVVKDWFELTEKIKYSIKNTQTKITSGSETKKLLKNPLSVLDTSYFKIVRKVCGTTNIFQSLKDDDFRFYFMYESDAQLNHSIILVTTSTATELHIPFYGFYAIFNPDEQYILPQFINHIEKHFQEFLSQIEQNHDSYMEDKYGNQFIKLKKNEMQYELNKQLGEILSKKISEFVTECSPQAETDCKLNNNSLKAIITIKNQRFTYNFNLSELKNLLEKKETSLKSELQKILIVH